MKVVLAAVMSANGKITAGKNTRVHDWSSKEDQKYFASLKAKARLIIMGRGTFDAAKKHITLSPKTLRVVMTQKPERFARAAVPGQLEFTAMPPKKLLGALAQRGYREALLTGGSEVNTLFLRAHLVDEVWLTVEPKMFGRGKGLLSEKKLNINTRLLSIKRLNKNGTLLLKYSIDR